MDFRCPTPLLSVISDPLTQGLSLNLELSVSLLPSHTASLLSPQPAQGPHTLVAAPGVYMNDRHSNSNSLAGVASSLSHGAISIDISDHVI